MRIGILSAELGHEDVHENKRLAREIRLKGHWPVVINYRKTVLAITKNRRLLYQPDKQGVLHQVRVSAVIPRINEADEQSINLATLALECLISGGAYSTATPESIRLSKNKISSLMALSAAGISVPRTAAITGTEAYEVDIDKVLKKVEPAISKRLIVKTNIGTQGRGVMSANSRAEARAIVDGFLANNIPIMLQQFVEPSRKNTYTDLRFLVVNYQVVGAMQRLSTRKNEIRANISLGGRGLPYQPSDAEVELAKKAAKAVGLAVAGVDIIPSGRKRLVIEANSSPGFAIEELTKVNVAKKIVALAISNAKKSNKSTSQKIVAILNTDITVRKPASLIKR
jgi:ribosomal protein S6--L-glutamate ligase